MRVDGEGRGGADENQVSEQQGDREEEVDSGNDEANSGGTTQEIMRSQAAFYHADVGSCVFHSLTLFGLASSLSLPLMTHRRAGGEDACSQLEKEEGLDGEEWGSTARRQQQCRLSRSRRRGPRLIVAASCGRRDSASACRQASEACDPFSRQTRIFVGCVAGLLEFFSVVNSDGIAASAQSQRRNEHEQSSELLAPLKPLTAATRALCVPIVTTAAAAAVASSAEAEAAAVAAVVAVSATLAPQTRVGYQRAKLRITTDLLRCKAAPKHECLGRASRRSSRR